MNIELTDGTTTATFTLIRPPLVIGTIEGATDIVTLDNNMSTYFTYNKRQWAVEMAYMSEAEFNTLKGFYDRQWTLFQYPLLSIDHFSVVNIPVRMYLDTQNVIDNCGTIENVQVRFRESIQMPDWSS
jgi:hypothetical protein